MRGQSYLKLVALDDSAVGQQGGKGDWAASVEGSEAIFNAIKADWLFSFISSNFIFCSVFTFA